MSDEGLAVGRALVEILQELPGAAEEIVRDVRAYAGRTRPVVTFVGAYNTGKSSLIKRILVDDGREVPAWLNVSGRPETFDAAECEAVGCTLRDTPGLAAGQSWPEHITREAVLLTDAVVVVVTPQLLSDRDPLLEVVSGRLFWETGMAFPPSSLAVVVSRMDATVGDPEDDPDGYSSRVEAKLEELRAQLRSAHIDPDAFALFAACADPFQRAQHVRAPRRDFFASSAPWDGIHDVEQALRNLPGALSALRTGALNRYFLYAAKQARDTVDDELGRQQSALDVCQDDIKRLTLYEGQLDTLARSAQARLQAAVQLEIGSAARMHGLSLEAVTREAERALQRALSEWDAESDAGIRKLAREAGEEVAARNASPGARFLDSVLSPPAVPAESRSGLSLVDGLRRLGPRLLESVRSLHELALGLSLADARKELARVRALGGFEQYVDEVGRRRLVRNSTHAEQLQVAVQVHGVIAALGPVLLECAALIAQDQEEKRKANESELRLGELRAQIERAAHTIATAAWEDWQQQVAEFRRSLHERRAPLERLRPQLTATVERLERTRTRLTELGTEAAWTGAGPVTRSGDSNAEPPGGAPVAPIEHHASPDARSKRTTRRGPTSARILFLASNPDDTLRLSLGEEAREIEEKLRASDWRDSLTLKPRWAVRTDDLIHALNEDRPTIVHFSGHGAGIRGLALHNEAGSSHYVTAEALSELFTTLKGDIRVVVLNACATTEQAEAIATAIDCVVGMRGPVDDMAARTFAASFYRALGFARSVQNAFDQGKVALKLGGLDSVCTPELWVRQEVNADEVFVVGP